MFAAAVFGIVLASTPSIDVAFSARFYYPPGDKRIRKFAVYVCDIRGKNRKRISAFSIERQEALWSDRTKLVWTTQSPSKVIVSCLNFETGKVTILPGGIGRRISDDQVVGHQTSLMDDESDQGVTGPGHRNVKLRSGFLVRDDGSKIKLVDNIGFADGSRLFGSRAKNQMYFVERSNASSAGNVEEVFLLDWTKGRMLPVLSGIQDLNFNLHTGLYTSRQSERPVSKYGKGRVVWTNEPLAGNLYTGK